MWLKDCRTNNDPLVTAGFYLEYVRSVEGCPIVFRTDCETESSTMAAMQCCFRSEAGDQFGGINAHKYGSSHSNQRIETFLGIRWRSAISTHQMSYRWFQEYFEHASAQTDFPKPSNWNEALNLYQYLVNVANNGINV